MAGPDRLQRDSVAGARETVAVVAAVFCRPFYVSVVVAVFLPVVTALVVAPVLFPNVRKKPY